MKKIILLLASAIVSSQVGAQAPTYGIDLQKLFLHGELMLDTPPLPPNSRVYLDSVAAMKAFSKSDAPIQYYWRVEKMKQQPNCGRVSMIPIQGNLALGPFAMGAFLCDNGAPPFLVCPEKKSELVPPTAKCQGGRPPVFTAEAQAMYDKAIKDGGITTEEVIKRLKNAAPQK